jgi:MYXO-CTERM domain-containing protein
MALAASALALIFAWRDGRRRHDDYQPFGFT